MVTKSEIQTAAEEIQADNSLAHPSVALACARALDARLAKIEALVAKDEAERTAWELRQANQQKQQQPDKAPINAVPPIVNATVI